MSNTTEQKIPAEVLVVRELREELKELEKALRNRSLLRRIAAAFTA